MISLIGHHKMSFLTPELHQRCGVGDDDRRNISILFRRYRSKEQDLDPLRDCFSDSTHSDTCW